MTGDRVDADEAYRLGLLNHVFPNDSFHEKVQHFARRLAAGPPETLARIKRGVYLGVTCSVAETLTYEHDSQAALFLSEDAREGMRAFVEKRAPEFGKE